jgi:hypothetical protein
MINIETTQPEPQEPVPESEVDDTSGIVVTGFLRISDPESGEIIVQGRA